MGNYSRTFNFVDGTVAYGSQLVTELDALGSSVNNIVNAQISSGAAIADTKLATISTAGKVNTTALVTTSQAQGDILIATGASTWERLGYGTSGYFLKTQGVGANPIWADAKIGMTLEQTGTPSAAADFTISGLVAGAKYKLVFNMTQNTSNGYYTMIFNGDSGANYQWASYGYGANGDTKIFLEYSSIFVTEATYPFFGTLEIQPRVSNNKYALLTAITAQMNSGGSMNTFVTGARYSGASDISSLTIATSAGTMTGSWSLYRLS
jgi:hypothetical protein